MEDIQAKMNSVLSDPDMMQKIMAMAQSLGESTSDTLTPTTMDEENMPQVDLAMVQKISGFIGQSNIDKDQRNLLNALLPYLSRERITKLEKAMRAAKLASIASVFLSKNGLSFNMSR